MPGLAVSPDVVEQLVAVYGLAGADEVVRLAGRQARLEELWVRKAAAAAAAMADLVLRDSLAAGRLELGALDFEPLVMAHAYAVTRAGLLSTSQPTPVRVSRLAAPPAGAVPKNLRDLQQWYQRFKKTRRADRREAAVARRMKAEFAVKIRTNWERYQGDLLGSDAERVAEARRRFTMAIGASPGHAKQIIATETTRHFNRARRQIYDESPDVSHYLFMAVRDHRTTQWCKTRHGLVYAKDDPLLEDETPPIHWMCRSEVLPLSPHNPNHLRLIETKSRQRRNNSPFPLSAEWHR